MIARYACQIPVVALGAALCWVPAASGQTVAEPGPPSGAALLAGQELEFESDLLTFDENSGVVTATGNVVVQRGNQRLTADEVVYDRHKDRVMASGKVLLDSSDGNRLVADHVELTDTLRDGAIENLLLILSDGSRLAARDGTRVNGVSTLNQVNFSPCDVVDAKTGCPKEPVWSIKAARVVHDPLRGRVFYSRARLEAFGVPIVALPRLSHPDSFEHSYTGILTPNVRYSHELGAEFILPYLWSIAPDRDLTATAHIYTSVTPVAELEYRQLFAGGPITLGGRVTYAKGEKIDENGTIVQTPARLRGYFDGRGQLEHGDGWRSSFSSRLTNDDNFPGRYQISLDTRLRSTYALEQFRENRYFSVRGWYFQDLAPGAPAGRTPFALPLVEFLWRPLVRPLGGNLLLEANSLALYRTDGQSMARALASATWERSLLTGFGQRITFTGLVRGDLYKNDNAVLADAPLYAGVDGWHARGLSLAAADVEWPLAGPFMGGAQTITPRLQLVASTSGRNAVIPNEDARAIDLEEANLFALNRFSGYDRWEGGARLSYGVDWRWTRPGLVVTGQLGQSYRFTEQPGLFPEGTGLSRRLSDIVGRASVRFGGVVEVTQRLQLDKDNLAVRRSETDLAIGSSRSFVSIGYLRFNRDINLEDLRDHEEVRAGARLAFAKYWAVFGSAVVDLTSRDDDPATTNNGFQPIRHRLGISYADECFDFSLTWRRNYVDNPNARLGNTFYFSISLKNLG